MPNQLPFLAAALALSAAVAWGSGDFSGGIASRRVGSFRTILISYTIGLLALVIVALANRETISPTADLLWGALAGLLGMAGLGLLLRGFTAGRMGIVAPVSASLAAAVPVLFTALTEGLPGHEKLLGFGLALVGIWLLSRPQALGGRPAGLGLALAAGLGFGGFFIALDQIGEGAVFWPLAAGRLACCALMLAYALAMRQPVRVPRALLGVIALAGVLDVAGNLFFLLATQTGRLDVATVLGSLYPAVTALLACRIAREKLAPGQVAGVVTAVAAIVVITL